MKCRPESSIDAARHIARSAQQNIKSKTGINISLMLDEEGSFKTPERMLDIIAAALNMNPLCFQMKKRERAIAELRFIGAYFLRIHFPRITLYQIAALFGGQDHSSVISGLMRANNLIYTRDARFIEKYNAALRSVEMWLKKEMQPFELAASA
jgi:chromosomal replication initiation ATPase DnaA